MVDNPDSLDRPRILVDDTLFPMQDDINYEVIDGVMPTFDLTKLMSTSLRVRPAWGDLAKSASRVLYQAAEQYREALGLIRTPENQTRVLKILSLKMLGLDYRSDALTDIDYDRALNTISMYNETKGNANWINWLGYIQDTKYDLSQLWCDTPDYDNFIPGPGIGWKKVYDTPQGPWYPTTHVGLLYEEYITPDVNEAELTELFYRMAPIHLVLEWIAAQITVSLGTIWIGLNIYETEEATIPMTWNQIVTLYFGVQRYETTEDVIRAWPHGSFYPLNAGQRLANLETSRESMMVINGPNHWTMLQGSFTGSWQVVWPASFVVQTWDKAGNPIQDPLPIWDYAWSASSKRGALILPRRTNKLQASRTPNSSLWKNISTTINATGTDATGESWVQVSSVGKGYFESMIMESGTHAVSLKFRTATPTFVAIERGINRIIINTADGTAVGQGTADLINVEHLPNNTIRLSGRLTGNQIRIYPCWGSSFAGDAGAAGTIFWYSAQAQDANFISEDIDTIGFAVPREDCRWTTGMIPQMEYDCGFFQVALNLSLPAWQTSDRTLAHWTTFNGSIRLYVDQQGIVRIRVNDPTMDNNIGAVVPLIALPNQIVNAIVAWSRPDNRIWLYVNGAAPVSMAGWMPEAVVQGVIGTSISGVPQPVSYQSVLLKTTTLGYRQPSDMPTTAQLTYWSRTDTL